MIDPNIFILYIGESGRLLFESACRTVAQYVTQQNHDDVAYSLYYEIVTEVMDIFLEIPGGANWWDYTAKLGTLPNIEKLIGREFLRHHLSLQNLLRQHTSEFGISLYFHMREQEFLKLSSLYTVNFDYQMSRQLNLEQLILVKFPY